MGASTHAGRGPHTEDGRHRLLLENYQDFGLEAEVRRRGGASLAALRGAGAFIAAALAAGAPWEERGDGGDPCAREAAAFEHGFLRMELEAYQREVAELDAAQRHGSRAEVSACRRRLLRRIHRIEAVLHLHVDASADRAQS